MARNETARLHLNVGSGLSALLPALVERLRARRDPFERPFVCVPHRELQTWLRRKLADALGVVMNLEHGTVEDVLFEAARIQMAEPPPVWEPLSLAGAIRDELARGAKARDWLEDEGSPEALERRRFVVARQLADLFLDYDRTHPELLAGWERGETPSGHADEPWQAALWRRVRSRAREVRERAPVTLSELCALVKECPPDLARPVHIFGFGHFAERERKAIEVLSEITEVTVYIDSLVDENAWEASAPESPLRRWGRPLRDSLDALSSRADTCTVHTASTHEAVTALERLRRAIVAPGSVTEAAFDDGSLHIAGAPGERREAEVVANAVVQSVVESEPARTRRLSDVAVLLPRFSEQIVWLEDRFDALRLPRSVPHGGRSARLFTLVQAMLGLPSTSFERAFVLDVLLHPCFRDAERLASAPSLCAAAGIYLGADSHEGELAYLEGAPLFSWAQGLDRLLLSSLTDGVSELEVPALSDGPIPLLDVASSDEESARALSLIAASLLADLRNLASWRAPASSWSQALDAFFRTYLRTHDERDERALYSLLRSVERLALLAFDDGSELTYPEVVAALESELATRGGGYGRPLTDGVTVARMAADRIVPRETVVVTGLGESRFPSRSRVDAWDVRAPLSRPYATRTDLERLAFLQAVFSAERRLVLTWVSKDPARDADLSPSSLVVELCAAWPSLENAIVRHPLKPYSNEYFRSDAGLRSFDEHAARTAAAMSLSTALEEALGKDSARLGEPFDLPTWRRALSDSATARAGVALAPAREPEERVGARRLNLWSFIDFLRDPADGFAGKVLRMKSWSLGPDEEATVEHEPLELEPKPIWDLVRNDVVWRFLAEAPRRCPSEDEISSFVERELSRLERLGRIPVGRMRPGDLGAHITTLLASISDGLKKAHAWELEMCVPVIGPSRKELPARAVRPVLLLPSAERPVEITHQGSVLFRGADENVLLGFRASTSAKRRDDDFRFRLELLLLLLAGFVEEDTVVQVIIATGATKSSTAKNAFRLPRRAAAEEYLLKLAEAMTRGMPPYRLPATAIEERIQELTSDDDDERTAAYQEVLWRIADDWPRPELLDGFDRLVPLRDRDGLRLPTQEELTKVVRERFTLLAQMEVTT